MYDIPNDKSYLIENEVPVTETIIYIAYDINGFSSPIFRKSKLEHFKFVPNLDGIRLNYDALERLHLATLYTGRSNIF